jgi:CHAT domain-containing protein
LFYFSYIISFLKFTIYDRVKYSLWKVDDQATAEMMTRFYKLILEKKLPPVQALREAQLQMQKETEWKSPYYWSAFILQGEWR